MNPKPKRIVDRNLIKNIRNKPCLICGKLPVDVHHMTTRGSGGGDIESNLAHLCRKHHQELHQYGLKKFSWKYPRIKEWLTLHKRLDLLNNIH